MNTLPDTEYKTIIKLVYIQMNSSFHSQPLYIFT